MKVEKLLLVAIIATSMIACNSDETPDLGQKGEATISVLVRPVSNRGEVKSVGNISGTIADESAIKLLEVYIFNGDTPAGYKSSTTSEVKGIETTPGAKTIVVVANAGGSGLGAVSSKTELLAKTRDVPVNIATNGLVMTGESSSFTVTAGQNYYGYAAGQTPAGTQHSIGNPLKIERINARVAIIGASLSTNITGGSDPLFNELRETEVAMFNIAKAANIFTPNTNISNPAWLRGDNWAGSGVQNGSTTDGAFKSVQGAGATQFDFPITNIKAPYYYVNPNSLQNSMLIVLRGKPYKNNVQLISDKLYTDAAGYTYYPVVVNGNGYNYGGGTDPHYGDGTVKRNYQYNIILNIKKIGYPSLDPVEDSFLDVIVDVEPWKFVPQTVDWE